MAEFKLGRIKFVWQGIWAASTTYVKDDVVRYAGKTYICVIGHTSSPNFNTDFDIVPSKWNLLSDGQRWRSEWAVSTSYEEGDIVKYGGNTYICIDGHTSAATTLLGLENNVSDWQTFSEGFDWKGDWAVSTRYKLNDIVNYGSKNYICNTYHTSAATAVLGLEADQGNWDLYTTGVDYKGTWVTATRYKVNDVVKYGASLWICTAYHTAGATFSGDSSNWSQFVEGIEFENDWNSGTAYQPGDIVIYGGYQYIAKTQHTNANPRTSAANWDLFSYGVSYQSNWSISTSYRIGEIVRLNGNLYIASTDSSSYTENVTATNNTSKYFTCGSTTNMVANMAIKFTGTTFGNVFTDGTYYIKTVVDSTNFTISTTVGGTEFTPVGTTGLMTITFSAKPPNTSYWTLINSNINWRSTWSDDTEYVLGDTVRYGSNVYICKLAHRSEGDDGSTVGATGGGQANSRPDLDLSSTYWQIFNLGSLNSVMTTLGDMVYYAESGPARLPIGIEGQVLRVGSAGIPEWVSWGATDHVYYVASHGEDRPYPIHGGTLDKPWKTIRYAALQVEKGCRNPNAQYLLELNRVFIQREVSEWIDYQVVNNISPFTTSFVYSQERCERDTGWVIDALIFDIAHGGNVRTRGAALAYVNALTEHNEVAPYTNLSAESDEDIAAYNYMLTVIGNVLDNEPPAVSYQVLNGDNSTAIVSQYIDVNLPAEPTAIIEIPDLVEIITTALADENASNIPERYAPNNTINVKTGQYREILPIIVPESTTILGDELRSTNAGPAGSLISADDVKYSVGALTRLETVLGQIVVGSDVVESLDSTQTQDINFPFAQTAQATLVSQLVRTAQHRIDFLTNQTNMISYTLPTGYNSAYLNGYGDARKLILENKEFIKEEIAAYVDVNYPNVLYSRTICKRDVGYIIDALVYDLTYGGSTQTLNAGLAYFDGPGSTLLIDSTESAATIAAYGRLKSVIQLITANSSVTASTGNTATQWTDATNLTNGSLANAFIGTNIDIITAILTAGSTTGRPNLTVTSITGTDTLNTTAAHGLEAGDLVVPRTTAYGLTADVRYYVIASGLTATAFKLSTSYAGSAVGSLTNGSGLTYIVDYEDRPPATNAVTSTTALITAYTTLSAAVGTIVTNMTSFITTNYPSLSYNTAKCQRDARIILDAVGYDFMFNTNFQTVKAAYSYLRSSANDVFDNNQKDATRAAFTYVKNQAKSNVGGDATAQSRIETLLTTLDDIIFGATTEGLTCSQAAANTDYAILQIERNRNFIVDEITDYIAVTYTTICSASNGVDTSFTCADTSWMQRNAAIRFSGTAFGGVSTSTTYYVQNVISSTKFTIANTRNATVPFGVINGAPGATPLTVSLYYDTAECSKDLNYYLDAFKYDLRFTGNYKTCLAARYYANAVKGSLEEDMYYVRNGTGIRNQTLEGLTGDLLAPNAYGTSRVSAGAYVSLDPGFGPDDYHAWIISRSPYVQNVTTFGYAAIGQKIDGALHNGGNDSIVSNDFTQVISDGIGAWVTNNARAELVSVFTYYSHIGYLSENGGRIRGTNGNNSYGDFGSVAEGFDANETPITAIVDNSNYEVEVGSVLTNGIDTVYQFEYNNAGQDYTVATWSINGPGAGVDVEQTEFRDGAVFQVRLLDNVDDSSNAPEAAGNFGGFGYVTNSNTAQSGTSTSLTLAAVDDQPSAAYIGMKLLVTGGAGAGQFGIITAYNSGTKIASVVKETTAAAGWDHIVQGTTIVSPDASSTYIVEPHISFTAPAFGSSSVSLATALTFSDVAYAPTTVIYNSLSPTGGTGTGFSVLVVRKGTKYSAVSILNAGTNYTRLDTLTIAGTSLGGAATTNDITITVTSVNSTTGAILNFENTGVGVGGNFVTLGSGQTVDTSVNATAWTARTSVLPYSTSWTSAASGNLTTIESAGAFVIGRGYVITALGNTVFTSIGAAVNIVGTYFIATGAGSGTGTATPIANHLVAIASGSNQNAYSTDGGVTWTAGGALPSSGSWTSVAYGDGKWVAIRSGSTASAYSSNGGVTWTAGGALPASTTWQSVTYGGGKFVAVATGGTQAAYSSDAGVTWTTATLPSSTSWNSVAYGNNRFVAVSIASNTIAAYSLNGINWTLSTLPATATWSKIAYGQGVFLAVASNSNSAASSEDGINWTTRALSRASGTGFTSAVFGNPNQTGRWIGVASTSTTSASYVSLGSTAKGRAYIQDDKLFAIRITEPGSNYGSAPTLTITDPNNLYEAPTTVRIGNGVVAQPSFVNRGTGYASATANLDTGDGFANNFQSGSFIAVKRLTGAPQAGANVVFATQPNTVYKLVQVLSLTGTNNGSIGAFFQISPDMSVYNSPADATSVTTRIRYSQVRLTGHDFLDIGTGNFAETNYPGTPTQAASQANETVDNNGGRVFYTSTDQDGNFRVGELFTIEQSTGVATLNADAFNIAGLSELTLGEITLGGTSATIVEFSTDPFFTANSDSVVPTQRAIKSYIAAQIGGGGASLNVNSIVAGFVEIAGSTITTTTGGTINMTASFNFQGGVRGLPVAWNYFLT